MHAFQQANSIQRRAKEESKLQDLNMTDAQELIARLMEENSALSEQVVDLQEIAAKLIEGGK